MISVLKWEVSKLPINPASPGSQESIITAQLMEEILLKDGDGVLLVFSRVSHMK